MTTPGEVWTPGGSPPHESGAQASGPHTSGPDDTRRRAVSSLPRLHGDEVRNRAFKRATRGVSEAEVRNFLHRVAEELDAGREREATLEERIHTLEEQLRNPPPVTEEQLLDALGAETARVLRSAQHAANEIVEKAEATSNALVTDAENAARDLRADAEAFVTERRREGEELGARLRSEAEARAQQLRDDAERQATEIRARATAEAEAQLAEALERGRSMVAEAKSVRERVLADLARRRRSLGAQLDELRSGRERLLEGYRVVRRTLSEATEALGGPAPPEPDLDLESLSSDEPEPVDAHLDALLAEADEADASAGEDHRDAPAMPEGAGVAPAASAEGEASDVVDLRDTAGEGRARPDDEESLPSGRGLRDYVKGALGIGATPGEVDDRDSEADAADANEPRTEQPRASSADSIGDAPADADREGGAGSRRDPQKVFAELRAQTGGAGSPSPEPTTGHGPEPRGGVAVEARETDDAGEAIAPEAAEPSDDEDTPVVPTETASEADGGAEDEPSGDAALLRARDDALEAVQATIARSVKREAQDGQNELLDAIRRAKRRKDLTPLLFDRDDLVSDLAAAIRTPVGEAYGADPPDAFVRELASILVGSLHDRLEAALSEGGDTETLTQRIGARYREWRGQELSAAVAEVAATAHSRGVFDTAEPGTPLRWVPARPGRCPDCDDNALEPTLRGEPFPTGQRFPPAHPGCRCLLVIER